MTPNGVIYRIKLSDIRASEASRPPGYTRALLAAGVADPDGVHWNIPLATLRSIWSQYDIAEGRGCEGCGK